MEAGALSVIGGAVVGAAAALCWWAVATLLGALGPTDSQSAACIVLGAVLSPVVVAVTILWVDR